MPPAPKAEAKSSSGRGGAGDRCESWRRRCGGSSRSIISTPAAIPGSGRDGRITKADVLTHLTAKDRPGAGGGEAALLRSPRPRRGARAERRVPMTRLRARIAERLVQAQSTAAMLTTFNEVDLKAVNELRARYKERFEKEHGVRLGFMSFFVKACVEALKRFPVVNASVDGNDIVYHEYYDIGVAVSTDRGLVVPVLRDADTRGFADIEKAVGELRDARTRRRDHARGADGRHVHDHERRRVRLAAVDADPEPCRRARSSACTRSRSVRSSIDGQVVVRPMMYLALTYDHRIIDGREAVQFLVAVKDALEDPARLLLQI